MFNLKHRFPGFIAVYLTAGFLTVILGFLSSLYLLSRSDFFTLKDQTNSLKAFFAAESGIEDAVFRIIKGKNYQTIYSFTVNGTAVNLNIASLGETKNIRASGTIFQKTRILEAVLGTKATGISFYYGAQVGDKGLKLKSNAKVSGNVYSNGNISGSGSNSLITGDAWAANNSSLDSVSVGVDGHAYNIMDSLIGRDAYFKVIDTKTIVSGTKYPNSPNPSSRSLPISLEQISQWEQAAQSAGVIQGNYQPSPGSSLGPIKIGGNLTFPTNNNDNPVVVAGPIWVTGNVSASGNAKIKLKDGLAFGYPIIADNPGDRQNQGKIVLTNNVITEDSSQGGYLLFISTNQSLSDDDPAILVSNNVNKDKAASIIYSLQGLIKVENNVKFKEITSYGLQLENNTEIVYEQGLVNAGFSSGPGAGWEIESWREIK